MPTRAVDVQLNLLGISIESEGDDCHTPCCKGARHRVVCRISAIDNIQPIGAWIQFMIKELRPPTMKILLTTVPLPLHPDGSRRQCQIGNVEVAVVENFNEGGETVEFIGVVRVTNRSLVRVAP